MCVCEGGGSMKGISLCGKIVGVSQVSDSCDVKG